MVLHQLREHPTVAAQPMLTILSKGKLPWGSLSACNPVHAQQAAIAACAQADRHMQLQGWHLVHGCTNIRSLTAVCSALLCLPRARGVRPWSADSCPPCSRPSARRPASSLPWRCSCCPSQSHPGTLLPPPLIRLSSSSSSSGRAMGTAGATCRQPRQVTGRRCVSPACPVANPPA